MSTPSSTWGSQDWPLLVGAWLCSSACLWAKPLQTLATGAGSHPRYSTSPPSFLLCPKKSKWSPWQGCNMGNLGLSQVIAGHPCVAAQACHSLGYIPSLCVCGLGWELCGLSGFWGILSHMAAFHVSPPVRGSGPCICSLQGFEVAVWVPPPTSVVPTGLAGMSMAPPGHGGDPAATCSAWQSQPHRILCCRATSDHVGATGCRCDIWQHRILHLQS